MITPYKVSVGVQNLQNPAERVERLSIQFLQLKLFPPVWNFCKQYLFVDEGDTD